MKIAQATKPILLHEITRRNIKQYGEQVLGRRAIPDIRDGLKPVNRRILHAMNLLHLNPKSKPMKSGRVVGETMGKFHCHGNIPIYDAMVNMAQGQASSPLIEGIGNFGDFNSSPAAERYTECRLTEFAQQVFLDANYLAVVPMVPTYDGSFQEPIYLPAKLPNILLNRGQGIAVGASTHIPPFKLSGVLELLRIALKGKNISPQDCLTHLEFDFRNGGKCLSKPSDISAYFRDGQGSLRFTGKVTRAGGTCKITELPPYFNYDRFAESVVGIEGIASCQEESSEKEPICIMVRASKSANPAKIKVAFDKVESDLACSVSFTTNVCLTKSPEEFDFSSYTIPGLIHAWVDYRIQLEKDSLAYQIKVAQDEQARLELLLLAISHLDDLVKILKDRRKKSRAEIDKAISKALKVTLEAANYISGLPLYRLASLEAKELLISLKNKKREITALKGRLRKPASSVMDDLKQLEKLAK